METKNSWLKRMALGGLCAVAAVLVLTLLLNAALNSIVWLGSMPGNAGLQLTFDRCTAYFGSTALAVAVELASVFALGAAIGLATLPFAETWTALLGLSLLHFFITGALAQLVGWAYQWFGMAPGDGVWMVSVVYLVIYIFIWGVRWAFWYAELRRMRKALKQWKEEN